MAVWLSQCATFNRKKIPRKTRHVPSPAPIPNLASRHQAWPASYSIARSLAVSAYSWIAFTEPPNQPGLNLALLALTSHLWWLVRKRTANMLYLPAVGQRKISGRWCQVRSSRTGSWLACDACTTAAAAVWDAEKMVGDYSTHSHLAEIKMWTANVWKEEEENTEVFCITIKTKTKEVKLTG